MVSLEFVKNDMITRLINLTKSGTSYEPGKQELIGAGTLPQSGDPGARGA